MTVRTDEAAAGTSAGTAPGTVEGPGAEQESVRRLVDTITGTWRAQALYAAVALGLPDHLAGRPGGLTAAALADAAGADADALARLLRLLAALDVVETGPQAGRSAGAGEGAGHGPGEAEGHGGGEAHGGGGGGGGGGGTYRLTAAGELLRTDAPRSLAAMVRIYGEEFHRAWGAVVPAVRTGTSGFQHAFGKTLHEYLRDPAAAGRFQRAMNAGNVFFPDVLDAYDFGGARHVVDVAGGSGMLLGTVLAARPGLRGTVVDQPHMVPVATAHLDAAVGPGRYEAVAGDVFTGAGLPRGADVYLLSRVLQDWDDAHCTTLLSHLREALAAGDRPGDARLLVLERVVPEPGAPRLLPLLYDLHLLMAAGGRERDLAGYRAVLAAAGLRLESVHELSLETSLLVAAVA
ncbi:methyltransferase [Streptomyces sp. NRRL S-87]|uniref:methyltransferase n=1 Tax=Streptomyces sp. NRRL S-87 TaxID=1463920 RepID=UPI001F2A98C6|nr:methyltransferase [Streptomyces sp. NRRL S-87]